MKRLYLLRHAKSSWDDPSLEDHDRPLAARGRKAAKRMGRYMAEKGYRPSDVLCSSATRARQTLDRIADAIPREANVTIERAVYEADHDGLLMLLRQVRADAGSVLAIGHNPTMESLTLTLAAGNADVASMLRKFPTAALAVMDFDAETWSEVDAGGGTLIDFRTPRELVDDARNAVSSD